MLLILCLEVRNVVITTLSLREKRHKENKLPKNSQQVYSTNKQHLHVLIPSVLNNILHYQGPPSPWNSQEARHSPFRKPLGFLSWQCSRLHIDCVDSNLKGTFLLKLNVKINTTLRTLGRVLHFYIQVCLIFLLSVFRMPNIFVLTPLRQGSRTVNPNWTVE